MTDDQKRSGLEFRGRSHFPNPKSKITMTDDPLFYLKNATANLLVVVTQFHADLNTKPFDIDDADSAIDNVLEAFNKVEKSLINLQDRNE